MKRTALMLVLVAGVLLVSTSCNRQRGSKQPEERTAIYQIKDSVIEGYCGSRTNADTLDIIPVGYDPLLLDMHQARLAGRILGSFDVGDKVKVMLEADKKTVRGALDFTTLCRQWMQRDSTSVLIFNMGLEFNIDGTIQMSNTRKAMERLKAIQDRKAALTGEDEAIGAANQNPMAAFNVKHYSKWTMSEGYIILIQEDMFGKAGKTTSDTASITLLRRDSLVLKTPKGGIFGILTPATAAEAKSGEKH